MSEDAGNPDLVAMTGCQQTTRLANAPHMWLQPQGHSGLHYFQTRCIEASGAHTHTIVSCSQMVFFATCTVNLVHTPTEN
jgi:hypothetical protein